MIYDWSAYIDVFVKAGAGDQMVRGKCPFTLNCLIFTNIMWNFILTLEIEMIKILRSL